MDVPQVGTSRCVPARFAPTLREPLPPRVSRGAKRAGRDVEDTGGDETKTIGTMPSIRSVDATQTVAGSIHAGFARRACSGRFLRRTHEGC